MNYEFDKKFHKAGTADEYVQYLIRSGDIKEYDSVFITDLSVNEETAEMLNKYYENGLDLHLIDHHKTALWLNKYDWATVIVEYDSVKKACGTSLFSDFISDNYPETFSSTNIVDSKTTKVLRFVELVRLWDTFEWKTSGMGNIAVGLNDLFHFIDREHFITSTISNIALDDLPLFNSEDTALMRFISMRKSKYIQDKMKKIDIVKHDGYNVALSFADEFLSELGNHICDTNELIDYSLVISMDNGIASLRSTKEDVDVSEIAKEFGGGGHKHAAGYKLNNDVIKYVKDSVFKKPF
jgi:oligoribonuclease NrnB/cAMP/cGMP phosphodiesterase (DHH superfamily)